MLADAAIEYLNEGLNPLPLKANKAPKLPTGHPFLYDPVPENELPKLFDKAEKIGIACGAVSSGFYCIDFDAHNKENIKEIFKAYMSFDGVKRMHDTGLISLAKTPSGGYHLYFKYRDEILNTKKLALWETKSVMIEIRGNGSYVATLPSEGYIHLSGVEIVKLEPIEPEEVSYLLELAESFSQYKFELQKDGKEKGKWAENWKSSTPDGLYNMQHQEEALKILSEHGWQYVTTRNDNTEYWTRPNKDIKQGFSATFNHFPGMFYVFSQDGACKPFEAGKAYSPFNILTLLKFDGDWKKAKDSLRQRFNMVDNDQFWSVSEKGNYSLNNKRFKDFLESNDYFKKSPNEASTFDFVNKDGIFVKIVYEKDIKDYVLDWVEENDAPEGVFNLMTGNLKFFKREFLSMLCTKEIKTLRDDKDTCYLYYQNCIVKITKDSKELLSYSDLNLSVWKDQVIDRDFESFDHHQSVYRSFIWCISGKDPDKYKAFQSVIGYLLHSYKTNSNNKAIIFNDEIISDNPNGRSGKGLFWNALKKLRKVQSLDGKTFDFNKSFPYQNVSTDCQVLVFDDVKKSFNFEQLFSVITEGITIEYKGKDSIKLDVTESPKIIITTNYTIQGDSASFNARKYDVEMSSYFSDKHTPIDEFGHELFNDWDSDEWNKFDNYMMECIRIYLENGLIDMPLKNLDYRKTIDAITIEVFNFYESIDRNEWYLTKDLYQKFINMFPDRAKYISQTKLTRYFSIYCKYQELEGRKATHSGLTKLMIEDSNWSSEDEDNNDNDFNPPF